MDFTPENSKNLCKFDYNTCYLYEDLVNNMLLLITINQKLSLLLFKEYGIMMSIKHT